MHQDLDGDLEPPAVLEDPLELLLLLLELELELELELVVSFLAAAL